MSAKRRCAIIQMPGLHKRIHPIAFLLHAVKYAAESEPFGEDEVRVVRRTLQSAALSNLALDPAWGS